MKIRYIIVAALLIYTGRVVYLLAVPIEINGQIESSCFEEGCVVFEGDWIKFDNAEYTHEVFTDDLSTNPQVPYTEYRGKLVKTRNLYYLAGAHMDNRAYIAVENSGEVSLLNIPWFFVYTVSNYMPVYRHVQE